MKYARRRNAGRFSRQAGERVTPPSAAIVPATCPVLSSDTRRAAKDFAVELL
jgi:hypothetical protein